MDRTLYYILKTADCEDSLSENLDKISLKLKTKKHLFK